MANRGWALCARSGGAALCAILVVAVGRGQSLPSYSLGDDPSALVQGIFGLSLFSPGYSTLACPQFNFSEGCETHAAFGEFGFLRIRPIPKAPFGRVQAFVKWHYNGLDSSGVGREIGLMVALPDELTLGISQHRYYAIGPSNGRVSPDGPGGGLWAGVFVEKDFRQNRKSQFRDGFVGFTLFPPHNEFDPKACFPGTSSASPQPCSGFARYRIRGGASLFPFKRRPSIFLNVEGYGFFGSTMPQKDYTWSATPIGAGGRAGIGFNHGPFCIGLYRDFYYPLGRYSADHLIGLYSEDGPFGGNTTDISFTWNWNFMHRPRRM